jgi:hypothetical protein
MLITGNKTVDFIITLLFYVFGFCSGLHAVFYYPSKARKAVTEGKPLTSEKTIRWVIRTGILALVFFPLAFAITMFMYFTGRW